MTDYFEEWKTAIDRLTQCERVINDIFDDVKKENPDTPCNVCKTYSHKGWCWYPLLARLVGQMDKYDSEFCEGQDKHDAQMMRLIYD